MVSYREGKIYLFSFSITSGPNLGLESFLVLKILLTFFLTIDLSLLLEARVLLLC